MNKKPITSLQSKDTLQDYYDRNNGRLPVNEIPNEIKKCKSFDLKTIKEKYHG